MISLDLAKQLRKAGLVWQPSERDVFVIPDRQMDTLFFVVTQLPALIQLYNGQMVVTFHGNTEWALDYVTITDVIWLPTETQLREILARLIGVHAPLRLDRASDGYRCQIGIADQMLEFTAPDGETAYALALLHVLSNREILNDEHI